MLLSATTNDIQKQAFLIRMACFFWFASKLLTYTSWIAERNLPTVSYFKVLDALPGSIHGISFYSCMALLLIMLFKPSNILMLIFLVVEIFSVTLDVLRVQAWEYLYLFIFGFYLVFRQRPVVFYRCLLMLLASTYIFSGLHKISAPFLHSVWDNFFLKDIFYYHSRKIPAALHYAGLLPGLGEFFCGLLLLLLKNKKFAVGGLIGMHIFILFFIVISLGQPENSVVPWNMMMIVLLLFIHKPPVIPNVTATYRTGFPPFAMGVLLVFWCVLPFSNLFGYWVHPLSSGMYTGKTPRVYICWDDHGKKSIPEAYSINKDRKNICSGGRLVSLENWTVQMTEQAPYTETWYFERLGVRLREKHPEDGIKIFCTYYPYKEINEIR